MSKVDIIDYPIFKAGTWNKLTFTVDDLKQIVETFNELIKVHHVPLKFGHNDTQPWTDGQPAIGWVTSLRMKGEELIASFSDIPDIVKELIKKRRFRAVSVELIKGAEYEGKKLNWLLDAVAILGAEQPAVRGLPDLSMFIASRSLGDEGGRRVTFKGQVNRETFTLKNPGGLSQMNEEDIKKMVAAAIAPYKEEAESLRAELSTWKAKFSSEETLRLTAESKMKQLEIRDAEREAEVNKTKVKMARQSVTEMLDSAVKGKKITPATKERIISTFGVNDDTRVVKIDVTEIRELFSLTEADKTVLNGGESQAKGGGGGHEDGDPNRKHKDVFAEVEHRVNKIRAESPNLSYQQATHAVFRADKELHREYLNTTPPRDRVAAGGN